VERGFFLERGGGRGFFFWNADDADFFLERGFFFGTRMTRIFFWNADDADDADFFWNADDAGDADFFWNADDAGDADFFLERG
jgi:hypothetical protein